MTKIEILRYRDQLRDYLALEKEEFFIANHACKSSDNCTRNEITLRVCQRVRIQREIDALALIVSGNE